MALGDWPAVDSEEERARLVEDVRVHKLLYRIRQARPHKRGRLRERLDETVTLIRTANMLADLKRFALNTSNSH